MDERDFYAMNKMENIKSILTKREYFAGLFMQSLLHNQFGSRPFEYLAQDSILAADALIAELEKGTESDSMESLKERLTISDWYKENAHKMSNRLGNIIFRQILRNQNETLKYMDELTDKELLRLRNFGQLTLLEFKELTQ